MIEKVSSDWRNYHQLDGRWNLEVWMKKRAHFFFLVVPFMTEKAPRLLHQSEDRIMDYHSAPQFDRDTQLPPRIVMTGESKDSDMKNSVFKC